MYDTYASSVVLSNPMAFFAVYYLMGKMSRRGMVLSCRLSLITGGRVKQRLLICRTLALLIIVASSLRFASETPLIDVVLKVWMWWFGLLMITLLILKGEPKDLCYV